MNLPSKTLAKAVEEISQFPGIGKKTALRLALHLLKNPKQKTKQLSQSLLDLVELTNYCCICRNFCDEEICIVCSNPNRDVRTICVVEDVRDVIAIENTNQYKGSFHVLGGKISPMQGVGPEDLHLDALQKRIMSLRDKNIEIIFALSSTVEGDTTMFYLYKLLASPNLTFTTIARGISVGYDLEYADELTLVKSIQNRIPYR